jgi:hypothetical protein
LLISPDWCEWIETAASSGRQRDLPSALPQGERKIVRHTNQPTFGNRAICASWDALIRREI